MTRRQHSPEERARPALEVAERKADRLRARRVAFQRPTGWAARSTLADPTLPHQINVLTGGEHLHVACNCRWGKGPLGTFTTLAEAWALYDAHLPVEDDMPVAAVRAS